MERNADTIPEIQIADRCDRCGSRSYVAVTLSTGRLDFCAHHWRPAQDKIEKIALAIRDEQHKLQPQEAGAEA